MWFRNLVVFRLPQPWQIAPAQLEEALARRALQSCGALDRESQGWLEPQRGRGHLHSVGRQWLLRAGSEQKILPAAVVRQFTDDRAEDLEREQGFKPGRRQLRELKDRIVDELLPRAFARRRSDWVWIDPEQGWLVVDAASDNRAEAVLEMLRDTVDELPVRRLDTERSPATAMSEWLLEGAATGPFEIDRELELRSGDEEKATVRYLRHDLSGDEVAAHLAAGKRPTRLALCYRERISFVLTETGHLRRLGFLDVVRETLDKDSGDREAEFDSQFALMASELRQLLPDLVDVLGGERAVAG
ncbi:MAG: recombination-associated protein RdgC [Rhodocyclaceae bacterium]|nr:recombination-associated protein RdgC [Rhodocyclaceae bacterium]